MTFRSSTFKPTSPLRLVGLRRSDRDVIADISYYQNSPRFYQDDGTGVLRPLEYYAICGTEFKNRAEYVTIIWSCCVIFTMFFYQMATCSGPTPTDPSRGMLDFDYVCRVRNHQLWHRLIHLLTTTNRNTILDSEKSQEARNKPILISELDLEALLMEAYYKGQQELLFVVPFIAKILFSCCKTQPSTPNPESEGSSAIVEGSASAVIVPPLHFAYHDINVTLYEGLIPHIKVQLSLPLFQLHPHPLIRLPER